MIMTKVSEGLVQQAADRCWGMWRGKVPATVAHAAARSYARPPTHSSERRRGNCVGVHANGPDHGFVQVLLFECRWDGKGLLVEVFLCPQTLWCKWSCVGEEDACEASEGGGGVPEGVVVQAGLRGCVLNSMQGCARRRGGLGGVEWVVVCSCEWQRAWPQRGSGGGCIRWLLRGAGVGVRGVAAVRREPVVSCGGRGVLQGVQRVGVLAMASVRF